MNCLNQDKTQGIFLCWMFFWKLSTFLLILSFSSSSFLALITSPFIFIRPFKSAIISFPFYIVYSFLSINNFKYIAFSITVSMNVYKYAFLHRMPFSINWNTPHCTWMQLFIFIVKKEVERTLKWWKNKKKKCEEKIALMISHHLPLNSHDMSQILFFHFVGFSYFIHFNFFLKPNIIIKKEQKI